MVAQGRGRRVSRACPKASGSATSTATLAGLTGENIRAMHARQESGSVTGKKAPVVRKTVGIGVTRI